MGRERQELWKCTHPAEPWLLVTSSSRSKLMVSLVYLPGLPERGPLSEPALPTWRPVCSSFSSAPWSLGKQLAPPSWPSARPSSLALIPARGRQALALCLLWFQLGRPGSDYHLSETQIPQTHTNKTLSPSGSQLCLHQPKEVGTLNSSVLTQSLSPQLPGASWCLMPTTKALPLWGINATGKGGAVGHSVSHPVLQGSPGAGGAGRSSTALPLLFPFCQMG